MGSLIWCGPSNIQKILYNMPVVNEKLGGKEVTWCNQGIKSFTTNPATSFWRQNGINSAFERYILGRTHIAGEGIVIITRRNKGSKKSIGNGIRQWQFSNSLGPS